MCFSTKGEGTRARILTAILAVRTLERWPDCDSLTVVKGSETILVLLAVHNREFIALRFRSNVRVHPTEGRREAPLPTVGCNALLGCKTIT